MYAAFGDPVARATATKKMEGTDGEEGKEEKVETPYSRFDKNEMEEKMVRYFHSLMHPHTIKQLMYSLFLSIPAPQHKLNAEIAELEVRAADRRAAALKREEEARREAEEALDVDGSADGEGVSVSVVLGLEAADISMEGITV